MHTTSECETSFQPLCCTQAAIAGFSSEFIKAYGNRLFTIARHITQDDEDAANVLIDTFLQIASDGSQPQEDLWLTLVTIAVREAFSALHKRVAGPHLGPGVDCSGDLIVRELSVWRDDFGQRYSQQETAHILETSLRRLDPMARTVFVLRDIEQISIERIAQILSRSVAAVEVCLMRARLRLREALAPHLRLPQ